MSILYVQSKLRKKQLYDIFEKANLGIVDSIDITKSKKDFKTQIALIQLSSWNKKYEFLKHEDHFTIQYKTCCDVLPMLLYIYPFGGTKRHEGINGKEMNYNDYEKEKEEL